MKTRVQRRLAAAAAALALAAATAGGCDSSGTTTSPDETFRVRAPGDRHEVIVGLAETGRFRFEARGFAPVAMEPGCDAMPVFFMLYDGVPEATLSLFRYQLMQGRAAGFCTGIAVRGFRPEYPGNVFQDECALLDWDPGRWYAFEVAWDGSTIRTFVDGGLVFEGEYFDNQAPLIAAMGWPPLASCGNTGAAGIEFRRWGFEGP